MSSLRNSLHRRSHKERSQLSHRSRLGILEKHKDYVLRAQDYHSKKDRINRLREKAATRNKDEFYFSMTRERTEGGVHVKDRGNEALPVDIVKVLKTQDENYLRTTRSAGLKKIDKLKGQLSQLANLLYSASEEGDGADELDEYELETLREAGVLPPVPKKAKAHARRRAGSNKGKHIIFTESEEEARQQVSARKTASGSQVGGRTDVSQATAAQVASAAVDLGWKTSGPEETKRKRRKPRLGAEDEEAGLNNAAFESVLAATEYRTRLLKELSARLVRDRQLRYAERELEMQRLLMGKGTSRKLSGVERVDDNANDDGEDEDDRPRPKKKVDEKTWKPRVYKWRLERKR